MKKNLSLLICFLMINLPVYAAKHGHRHAHRRNDTELQLVMTKLLIVLGAVIVSAIVIYLILAIVKKVKSKSVMSIKSTPQNNLISSENLDDAIERFILESD